VTVKQAPSLPHIKSKQEHAMPLSDTPLPVSAATLDLAEQLLRSQTQGLTTNSCNSLSPARSRENLLSILEQAIADHDDQDDKDCADVSIDTIDWGRSSHHRHDPHSCNSLSAAKSRESLLTILKQAIADHDDQDDKDFVDISIDTIDWGRSSHHRDAYQLDAQARKNI
jgi:hypothetical protein